MGFNTTVFILNDQLDQIEQNPERFVRTLTRAIQGDDVYVPGQTTVMPTAHADVFRLYATHCNGITELSPYCRETIALAQRSPAMRALVLDQVKRAELLLKGLRETLDVTPGERS
jgi:hypothetical protein